MIWDLRARKSGSRAAACERAERFTKGEVTLGEATDNVSDEPGAKVDGRGNPYRVTNLPNAALVSGHGISELSASTPLNAESNSFLSASYDGFEPSCSSALIMVNERRRRTKEEFKSELGDYRRTRGKTSPRKTLVTPFQSWGRVPPEPLTFPNIVQS